ncbi:MAG: FtsQ-type POTRA domain-containing protein [Deinococcota bacterium]
MRRLMMLLVLGLLVGGMLLTRYYPALTTISVDGNQHHSQDAVLALANVTPGDPFLWVTSQRVADLARDPWVRSAQLTRTWPNTLNITIKEREPLLVFHDAHGEHVYAKDGTLLYGVSTETKNALVSLRGWGDGRLAEALALSQLLADYDLRSLEYSPYGFDINLANGQVFTPSADDLVTHWAGFSDYVSNSIAREDSHLAVYPWGVSVSYGR